MNIEFLQLEKEWVEIINFCKAKKADKVKQMESFSNVCKNTAVDNEALIFRLQQGVDYYDELIKLLDQLRQIGNTKVKRNYTTILAQKLAQDIAAEREAFDIQTRNRLLFSKERQLSEGGGDAPFKIYFSNYKLAKERYLTKTSSSAYNFEFILSTIENNFNDILDTDIIISGVGISNNRIDLQLKSEQLDFLYFTSDKPVKVIECIESQLKEKCFLKLIKEDDYSRKIKIIH